MKARAQIAFPITAKSETGFDFPTFFLPTALFPIMSDVQIAERVARDSISAFVTSSIVCAVNESFKSSQPL